MVLIVLGDLGRSPRMLYHAQSLLQEGHRVTCIGYVGEELLLQCDEHGDRLKVIRFAVPVPRFLHKRVLLPLYFIWRILSLSVCLLFTLYTKLSSPVDVLLIQNPPAIPLLIIALLYAKTHKYTGLVVDWHNVGYSMLSENSRRTTRLARRITQRYEQILAPYAHAHLAVTRAMQQFLIQEMKVESTVLYDCPPAAVFQPLSLTQQHVVLSRLHEQLCQVCPASWTNGLKTEYQTLLTEMVDGKVRTRANRPALVVSSTSWTADEDFDLLLQALDELDAELSSDKNKKNKKIIIMVTGKGPLKEHYEQLLSQRPPLRHICIATIWLSPLEYPMFIACADLGISLHTSTSGLDLPMKVQDCFGCGVPVCAMHFECLDELVQEGVNGRVFTNASQLCQQLNQLVVDDADGSNSNGTITELEKYKRAIVDRPRWHDNWVQYALPVIENAATRST